MSSRKMMILIGAIVIGCIAGFAVMRYVRGLEDAAYEGIERVQVLVAAADIAAGTDAATASSAFQPREVPRDVKPATSILSLDEISGKVALYDIPANSILVEGMFANPEVAVSSFSQTLPDGLVAVSFNFAEAQGVGRWLAPGDRVNIMVRTQQDANAAAEVADGGEGQTGTAGIYSQQARVLYQDVVILSVGQSTIAAPGQAASDEDAAAAMTSGLITFAVPPAAALRLSSVDESQLYLSLVPPSYEPGQIPVITEVELNPLTPLPGEDLALLTPYGPGGWDQMRSEITGEPTDSAFSTGTTTTVPD